MKSPRFERTELPFSTDNLHFEVLLIYFALDEGQRFSFVGRFRRQKL